MTYTSCSQRTSAIISSGNQTHTRHLCHLRKINFDNLFMFLAFANKFLMDFISITLHAKLAKKNRPIFL